MKTRDLTKCIETKKELLFKTTVDSLVIMRVTYILEWFIWCNRHHIRVWPSIRNIEFIGIVGWYASFTDC